MRIRRDGSLAWERRTGEHSYHYLVGAAILGDTVFALGAAKSDTYDHWCVRGREDGTLLGDTVVPGPTWDGVQGGAITLGDTVVGTGIRSREQGRLRNEGQWSVVAFDDRGRLAWEKTEGARVIGVSRPIALPDARLAFVVARLTGEDGTVELVSVESTQRHRVTTAREVLLELLHHELR